MDQADQGPIWQSTAQGLSWQGSVSSLGPQGAPPLTGWEAIWRQRWG